MRGNAKLHYNKTMLSIDNESEEVWFLNYPEHTELGTIVYIPLRGYVAEMQNEVANDIQNGDTDTINAFLSIICKKEKVDIKKLHDVTRNVLPSLTISITDLCNLRCKYCFFSADDNKTVTMSQSMISSIVDSYFEVISKTVDTLLSNYDKTIDISFAGGGEQTCAFKELSYAVDYINKSATKLGLKPRFEMPTNGVFEDEVREFIVNNIDSISLSLDGNEIVQNFHRPMANGSDSFKASFETAKYLYSHNANFAIRITVSNFSLTYLDDIINLFVSEFPGVSIGIEPLTLTGRAKNQIDGLSEPDKKIFAQKLSEIYKRSQQENFKVKNSAIAKLGLPRTSFCSNVATPNWVVSTVGIIYACTHTSTEMRYGSYDKASNSVVIDPDKLNFIRGQNIFNYPQCDSCFCKYTCAGDCADRRINGLFRCEVNRRVTSDMILKAIDLKGGESCELC
jgi:uncharacterized protein